VSVCPSKTGIVLKQTTEPWIMGFSQQGIPKTQWC